MAVLLVHSLVMGWHIPPQLRALAGLDGSVCHSETAGHGSPDQPAAPVDHLAHCPICLSVDGGKLFGPATAPFLPQPSRIVTAARPTPDATVPGLSAPNGFSARAPPSAV